MNTFSDFIAASCSILIELLVKFNNTEGDKRKTEKNKTKHGMRNQRLTCKNEQHLKIVHS